MTDSEILFKRALTLLPGGVSRDTILRKPHPMYAAKGEGFVVTDEEGNCYVDFANNMASLIHGHAFPPIVSAVTEQLKKGTCFTLGTRVEVEFAEHLCSRSGSFERVRFMNSGTEAVMAAIKACRAYTGRPKIAKVEGAYHGAYDYVEISQMPNPKNWGPSDTPSSVPLAAGTPEAVGEDVIVIPFNDADAAIHILERHRSTLAGVLVDPIPHRVGLQPADRSFIARLREWTEANGALLIFDEVITFRTEFGGAQERYGLNPDLTCLGKAIGGGFPVGAVAGRAEVMDVFKSGASGLRLPQSGTFSANPITMTAGLVAMTHFNRGAVERINNLGDRTREALRQSINVAGVPASVTGAGSMFRIHLSQTAPLNYRQTFLDPAGRARLAAFVDGVFAEGIMLANTGTGMLSTVMNSGQIDKLAEAVLASLRKLD